MMSTKETKTVKTGITMNPYVGDKDGVTEWGVAAKRSPVSKASRKCISQIKAHKTSVVIVSIAVLLIVIGSMVTYIATRKDGKSNDSSSTAPPRYPDFALGVGHDIRADVAIVDTKVFRLHWANQRTTITGSSIPDEALVSNEQSVTSVVDSALYTSFESLKSSVGYSHGISVGVGFFSTSLSLGRLRQSTFTASNVQYFGSASKVYRLQEVSLPPFSELSLTDTFVSAAKNLSTAQTNSSMIARLEFVAKYGTHIITKVWELIKQICILF